MTTTIVTDHGVPCYVPGCRCDVAALDALHPVARPEPIRRNYSAPLTDSDRIDIITEILCA